MTESQEPGRCVGRSCLCDDHELRVTRRCATEDLGLAADASFEDLLAQEIVRGFRAERHNKTHGSNTVGPTAGPNTATVLRRGHDHRGATWFDEAEGVVWLCGYARHRSGETGDAFPYFHALQAANQLVPDEEDLVDLYEDRAERFALVVVSECEALLTEARNDPNVEKRAIIGTTQPVGVLVHVVETLEQTFVAVAGTSDPSRLQAVLAALYSTRPFDDWEYENAMPTRQLDRTAGEFCMSIVHEH